MTNKRIGIILLISLIIMMIWSSLIESGLSDLETQFTEQAFVQTRITRVQCKGDI